MLLTVFSKIIDCLLVINRIPQIKANDNTRNIPACFFKNGDNIMWVEEAAGVDFNLTTTPKKGGGSSDPFYEKYIKYKQKYIDLQNKI